MAFTTYDNISIVSRRPCSRAWEVLFRMAWSASLGRPVRILVLGDSQEMNQGGLGYRYMPALNHAAAMAYGNWAETPLGEPVSRSRNPGTITGLRTGRIDGSDAGITASLKPPGFANSGYNYLSSNTGCFFALQPDWRGVAPDLQLGGGEYMDRASALVAADVFGWAGTGAAGEFAWNVRRTSKIDAYESGAATYTGTTSIGLQDAGGPILKGQTIGGTWAFSSSEVLQLLLTGNHAANAACLGMVRMRNAARTWGVVFQEIAASGYTAASFAASHSGMGQALRTVGPFDAILLNVTANDAYSASHTAVEHKSNLNSLIDLLRGSTMLRDAGIPVFINHDPYRYDGTAGQDTEYAQYAGAHREIEDERVNVLSLNTLRSSRVGGFNPTNVSLAGLTNRGAWAATTAYVVDDYVHMTTSMGFTRLFRCIANHTSAAADAPNRQNNNSISYWVEHRQHALSTVTFDGADDATHHSAFGARLKAQADWQAMLMAAGAGAPTRSRFN